MPAYKNTKFSSQNYFLDNILFIVYDGLQTKYYSLGEHIAETETSADARFLTLIT